LGISNVMFGLPLAVAVAHNGGAALLLFTVVSLVAWTQKPGTRIGNRESKRPVISAEAGIQ
jgi:heme A synthase